MKHSFGAEPRNIVVKTRLSPTEKEELDKINQRTDLSVSEYLRRAIFGTPVQEAPHISDLPIDELNRLIAEYGRIGNNLNQISRWLNSGGSLDRGLASSLRHCVGELNQLKYQILDVISDHALMF